MAYWWVNHNQTHLQEVGNGSGYLWAPQVKDGDRKIQFWLNMKETSVGDTVFSFAHGDIRAIGVVSQPCVVAFRPAAFDETGEQWSNDGWRVPVTWAILPKPFTVSAHMAKIGPLLPKVFSPVRIDGKGNQCYLSAISDDLGVLLIEIAKTSNSLAVAHYQRVKAATSG